MTLTEAVEEFYSTVYRLCLYGTEHNNFQAENCTHAIFEVLVLKWDNVKHTKDDIYRWLLKTTDNKLKEYYRQKQKDDKLLPLEEVINKDDGSASLYDKMITNEEIEFHKERILNSLTEAQRELYRDYFEKKLTYSEIAEKLGIKYTTAQMRVEKLREILTGKVNETFCLGVGSMLALKLLIALLGEK